VPWIYFLILSFPRRDKWAMTARASPSELDVVGSNSPPPLITYNDNVPSCIDGLGLAAWNFTHIQPTYILPFAFILRPLPACHLPIAIGSGQVRKEFLISIATELVAQMPLPPNRPVHRNYDCHLCWLVAGTETYRSTQ
jgi:hypothetical protein